MTDDKGGRQPGLLVEIYRSIPNEAKGIALAFIGFVLFMVLMMALPHVLTAIPKYIKTASDSAPGLPQCWDLKEVQGAVYRFNRCTGETQRVDLPTATVPASQPASAAGQPASQSKHQ